MKPGRYDLPTIWRGATYTTIGFTWLDLNGNPINLSGWTPQAKSLNIDFHPVVTDRTNGITQISLTQEETANLTLGIEAWDWIWVFSNGVKTGPFLSGFVEIKEPVTDIEFSFSPPPEPANA